MSIFKKHLVWNYPTCYQFHNYFFLAMSFLNMSWIIFDVTFTFICLPKNGGSVCFWPSYVSIRALVVTSTIFMIFCTISFVVSIAAIISSEIFYFILLLFLESIITIVQLTIFLFLDHSRQTIYLFSFLVFHIIYLVSTSCVAFNQYMLQWMNYPLHTYFTGKTFIPDPSE